VLLDIIESWSDLRWSWTVLVSLCFSSLSYDGYRYCHYPKQCQRCYYGNYCKLIIVVLHFYNVPLSKHLPLLLLKAWLPAAPLSHPASACGAMINTVTATAPNNANAASMAITTIDVFISKP
jgi:hypothetical protein